MGGFKKFLMRGNVIDLATAVVIGAAFTAVVNSFVKGIINPLVGAFGTQDLEKYKTCLKGPCGLDEKGESIGVYMQWGLVLSNLLTFLITAAVVYFIFIVPMNKMIAKHKAARGESDEKDEPTETELLKEIRDLLAAGSDPEDVRQTVKKPLT
jgi:large conductance mechanosensitive channel